LVELLIAVGIVAVLVALLFPAGSSVMKAARKSGCASNLRQVGSAQAAYSSEHNEDIVQTYDSEYVALTENLAPYLGGMKDVYIGPDVMYCPENEAHNSPPKRGFRVTDTLYNKGLSGYRIGYNINASIHTHAGYGQVAVKRSQIASLARTVTLFDFMYTTNMSYSTAPPVLTLGNPQQFEPGSASYFLGGPHTGAGNVLFCDGHVEGYSTNSKPSVMSVVGQTAPW